MTMMAYILMALGLSGIVGVIWYLIKIGKVKDKYDNGICGGKNE